MLALLLKLIDRCIDLAKRREQINRKLYEDFVHPAFQDVEAVYRNYSESLKLYRERIEQTNRWTKSAEQSIIALISSDRLFSEPLIIKLRALRNLGEIRLSGIAPFVNAVRSFIFVPVNPWTLGELKPSRVRAFDPSERFGHLGWPDHILHKDDDGRTVSRSDMGKKSFTEALAHLSTPRGALIRSLTEISREGLSPKEQKRQMLETVDSILQALQANYAIVVHQHLLLKSYISIFSLRGQH